MIVYAILKGRATLLKQIAILPKLKSSNCNNSQDKTPAQKRNCSFLIQRFLTRKVKKCQRFRIGVVLIILSHWHSGALSNRTRMKDSRASLKNLRMKRKGFSNNCKLKMNQSSKETTKHPTLDYSRNKSGSVAKKRKSFSFKQTNSQANWIKKWLGSQE